MDRPPDSRPPKTATIDSPPFRPHLATEVFKAVLKDLSKNKGSLSTIGKTARPVKMQPKQTNATLKLAELKQKLNELKPLIVYEPPKKGDEDSAMVPPNSPEPMSSSDVDDEIDFCIADLKIDDTKKDATHHK
ncbi:hypothetical protein L596_006390 [Steinernema carpocapsae]|uniref:Uncharacterized protein n=1 Tax=Steinernema carpocapsae TaxID=34508 RepID=A0A4V6I8S3_STECR|nr:hypothetical protein L596_006390 [Steinernema carpocapsae]